MKTLILALGLATALAAPAFAQSVYDDAGVSKPEVQTGAGVNPGGQTGVDYSATTRSIPSTGVPSSNDAAGSRLSNTDLQRGNQGDFFGPNGR